MADVAVGSGKSKKAPKKKAPKKTKKVIKKKAPKKVPKKKTPAKKSEPSIMLTIVERIEARKKKGLSQLLGQPAFW